MYSSFRVENFRGISKLVLEDMGLVNVLTGLNDAGKTSVLEALFLHAAGAQAGLDTIQRLRPGRGQQQLSVGQQPENPWQSLFPGFNLDRPVRLVGSQGPAEFTVELDGSRDKRDQDLSTPPGSAGGEQVTSITVRTKEGSSSPKTFTQTMHARPSNIPGLEGAIGMSVNFSIDPPAAPRHLPAALEKGAISADLAAGYSALRKRPRGVDVVRALRMIDSRIEALEVLLDNGRAELHASIGGTLIPFQLLGDGPVSIARYLFAVASVPDGILLIDEIGNGIHYSVLPKMWQVLYRAAKRLNVQIVSTTHSYESILAAQESIDDNRNDLRLFRLKRAGAEEETSVSTFGGTKLETAIEFNTELR